MARTDIDVVDSEKEVLLMPFSDKSTLGEIIEGIESLRAGNLGIKTNPVLAEIVKDLLLSYKVSINLSDDQEIIRFFRTLPSEAKEKTVEEIEGKKKDEPKSDLNKLKLDELVEAYDKATLEDKERIKLIIAKKQNIEISQVEVMISRQREIAKERAVLDNVDIEKLNESREVDKIRKREYVTEERAREILDGALIAEAKLRVDNFSEEITKEAGSEETKALIRIEIKKVILGEKSKLEIVDVVGPIKAKIIEKQTRDFVEKNPKTVTKTQLGEIVEQFDLAKANAPTPEGRTQIEAYEKLLLEFHNVRSPQILNDKSRGEVEDKLETDGHKSPGEINNAIYNVDTTIKAAYHPPETFQRIVKGAKELTSLSRELLPNTPVVRAFDNLMANAAHPKVGEVIIKMQRIAHLKIDVIDLVAKIPGVNTALVGIGEIAGFAAAKDFILLSTQVMAEQGTIPGAIAIFKAITTGAGVLEGAAGVEGITALSGMLGAFQGIPILGQIAIVVTMAIVAAMWVVDHIIKPLFNSLNGWFKENLNLNLGGVRDFFANDLNLGGFVGGIAQVVFTGASVVMGGISLLMGPILAGALLSMTAIIAPVIIMMTAGFMTYNLLVTQPMVAALVPPPPMATGGTCKPKEPTVGSGGINCNQNAPEVNIAISKEQFGIKADQWVPGTKNFARECFNDVVNRAQCAGIDPIYALGIWLHESGASNYNIPWKPEVEDFGIHGNPAVPPKNFSKQIDWFLKRDPSRCTNDPLIQQAQVPEAKKFWLGFSTNYLTGTCDPTALVCQSPALCKGKTSDEMKQMVTSGSLVLGKDVHNGETYMADFLNTFTLMDVPPPQSPFLGSKSCNNKAKDRASNEFINSEGILMVCSGPVDQNGNFVGQPGDSDYDPNAPGLVGEKIEGAECSVADKIVSTKQCDPAWANTDLPGPAHPLYGLGTICSAGCGPTSVSSILRNKNGSLTPKSVIFEDGSEYAHMNGEGSSLEDAKLTLNDYQYSTGSVQTCSQKDIAGWIREGKAVVVLANSYTGTINKETGKPGFIGHILVAVAIKDQAIVTKDPYYSNSTPFVTEGGIKEGQIKDLRYCLPVNIMTPEQACPKPAKP